MDLFFLMVSRRVIYGKENNMLGSQNDHNYYLAPYYNINFIA